MSDFTAELDNIDENYQHFKSQIEYYELLKVQLKKQQIEKSEYRKQQYIINQLTAVNIEKIKLQANNLLYYKKFQKNKIIIIIYYI